MHMKEALSPSAPTRSSLASAASGAVGFWFRPHGLPSFELVKALGRLGRHWT